MNELEREGRNLRWESSSPNCLTLGVNSALSWERRWTRARDFLVIPGILVSSRFKHSLTLRQIYVIRWLAKGEGERREQLIPEWPQWRLLRLLLDKWCDCLSIGVGLSFSFSFPLLSFFLFSLFCNRSRHSTNALCGRFINDRRNEWLA